MNRILVGLASLLLLLGGSWHTSAQAGAFRAVIGNIVFYDLDADGIQDSSERMG